MTAVEAHTQRAETQQARRKLLAAAVVLAGTLAVAGTDVSPLDTLDGVIWPEDRFDGYGDAIDAPLVLGDTLLVGLGAYPVAATTIDSAEPVIAADSALASITLVACEMRDPHLVLGSDRGELDEYCADIASPSGATLISEPGVAVVDLVAVVRPLEPGEVVIEGVAVTHARGPLHRTERTGIRITIDASQP